jgi:hypothetical protein
MKIRSMGAELFHPYGTRDGRTDERTEMTKLIVAFAILQTRLKKKNAKPRQLESLGDLRGLDMALQLAAVPYRWSGGADT